MEKAAQEEIFRRASALVPLASVGSAASDLPGDVYLVGGTLRDLILGRPFVDVDLAIDGDPSKLAAAIGTPAAGETKFGTISVQRDGHRYDLARTRRETYSHAGALPDVEPAGIEADLRRRDFTVNALALGLRGPRAGELIAAPHALADLDAGQLAVLHDRSFLDDPTRLLRLARYQARLGFGIAPRTLELATQAIAGGALGTLSGPRLGNELRLLAAEPDPVAAFQAAAALGLPWGLNPEMAERALSALPQDGRADLLVLACVFGPQNPDRLIPELDRLGFTATDRATISEAATRSADLAQRLSSTSSNSDIARSVGSLGIETVALAASQGSPSQSLTWLQHLRHLKLQITGDDLIQNGIPEGPEIGRALANARSALMDGTANDRDSQLQVALTARE